MTDPIIEMVDIKSLKPRPDNRNQHPKEQIDRLIKIIEYQGFRRPITVSTLSGLVVCGHGRLIAAKRMKLKEVPVIYQDYTDTDQEYADHIADNSLQSWAELDLAGINADIANLGPDFDIDVLGLKDFSIDVSEKGQGDDPYTKKIEIPIYEPKGPKPKIKECYDVTKATKLMEQIEESNLPRAEKDFLSLAAQRHVVFDYEKIAELYAHSDQETKELFEKSALVIIDFDKAIENGFVKLAERVAAAYQDSVGDDES